MITADVVDLIAAAAADVAESPDEASRRWELHPVTIAVAGAVSPIGIFDGDGVLGTGSTPIPLISLIGYCAVNARVMVLRVPPAGNYVIADLSGAQAQHDTVAAAGTTVSVGYTTALTGGDTPAVSFTAPASGSVEILNNSALLNSGALITLCTPYVREGSTIGTGSDVLAASDTNAIYHQGTSQMRAGSSMVLDGLTPGAAYNAVQAFRVTGGTGTYGNQTLIVKPLVR